MNPPEYDIAKVRGDTLEYDVTVWNYRYGLAACKLWLTLKESLDDADAPGLQATTQDGEAVGSITVLYDGIVTAAADAPAGALLVGLDGPLPIWLPKGTVLGFGDALATLSADAAAGQEAVTVAPLPAPVRQGDTARVGKLRAAFPPASTAGFTDDVTLVGDVQIKYPSGNVYTMARIRSAVSRDATRATA